MDKILNRTLSRLAELGIEAPADAAEKLLAHAALVRRMNPVVGGVSRGDAERVIEVHTLDALALAPFVAQHGPRLLDIGSGAGFPALPLKVVLPQLDVVLVERSFKKAGFLRQCVGALGLESVRVVHGSFPEVVADALPDQVTARAVERPEVFLPAVEAWLPEGAVFWRQHEAGEFRFGSGIEEVRETPAAGLALRGVLWRVQRTFHVEQA